MAEQQFPEPCIGALIFNPENKILLVKTHKFRGDYAIPGGHVELGETVEQSVKREVKEETNLDVYGIEFLGVQDFIFDKIFWKKKHFVFLDFACKTNSSNVTLNDEGQEYVWISISEAMKLPVEPYSKNTIKVYLKKK